MLSRDPGGDLLLAKCKLDITSSPNLRRDVKRLAKTYPHIRSDLESLKLVIESDYSSPRVNANRLMMPKHPELQGKVWKYDCKSSDINKHQRESARLVCMFLNDTETLYAVHCFVRPNNSHVEPKAMAQCMKDLRAALANPIKIDEEDGDPEAAIA